MLKETRDEQFNKHCICLYAGGALFFEGNKQQLNYQLNTGDRIIVRMLGKRVEWLRYEKVLCEASVDKLLNYELFPVCWIRSSCDEKRISINAG